MSDISPSPWRKKIFNDGSLNIVSGPGGLGFVCQFGHAGIEREDRELAEADGFLICAAPDLLAACRAVIEAWQNGPDGDADAEARTLCARAIVKAEGRS